MATDYVRIDGLDGLVRRLRAFPKEMAKNGGPIRSALAKGGKIIREQAKANVRKIISDPNKDPRTDGQSTGTLEKSIILKRNRDPRSRGATEIYSVRLKRGKYASGVSVTRVGKIHEFGSEKHKAYSWLRLAAESRRGDFFTTVASELAKGIAKVERQLGAGR